jgi:sugar lactone lactonase YvrE
MSAECPTDLVEVPQKRGVLYRNGPRPAVKPNKDPQNMRTSVLAVAAAVAASLVFVTGASAQLQTNGVAVSDFATGFASTPAGVGPIGIAVDAQNRVFVVDAADGFLYRFSGPGQAGPQTRLGAVPISTQPGALAFDSGGRLYAALIAEGRIVEVDPETGAIIRTVTADVPCPLSISFDPLSGNLYSSSHCSQHVWRITNPTGTSAQATQFADVGGADGIVAAPDGTIYTAAPGSGLVRRVTGAGAAVAGQVSTVANVPGADGLAVSTETNNSGRPKSLIVNATNGKISRIEESTGVVTDLVTGGTRGDFVAVGADGCFYATQTSTVMKVTNTNGQCRTVAGTPLTPTTPPRETGNQNPGRLPRKRCVDRRKFTFRLHHGPRTTVVRVIIFVNGVRRKLKVGDDIKKVTLRRLPRKKFRVRVVSIHSNGARLISVRTYKGCKKSKPKTRRRGPRGENRGNR